MVPNQYDLQFKIQIPLIGLSILAVILIGVHLIADFNGKQYTHLAMSLLFWMAAVSLVLDKYRKLNLRTDAIALVTGSIIVMAILSKSFYEPSIKFLSFSPLFSAIGLALIASGFQGLKQYSKEFLVLSGLGLPILIPASKLNIVPLTAGASAFLLWYLGFAVYLQDQHIVLPNGGVEVVAACSGLNLIIYMLSVSIIFLALFPTNRAKQLWMVMSAVVLGFFMNVLRIVLLAVLSTRSNPQAFEYWHSEEGAFIFVVLTVIAFGVCTRQILRTYG